MPFPFQPEWAERGAEVVCAFSGRVHVEPLGEIAKVRPRSAISASFTQSARNEIEHGGTRASGGRACNSSFSSIRAGRLRGRLIVASKLRLPLCPSLTPPQSFSRSLARPIATFMKPALALIGGFFRPLQCSAYGKAKLAA